MPLPDETQKQIKDLVVQCRESLLAQNDNQSSELFDSLAMHLPHDVDHANKALFFELIRKLLIDDKRLRLLSLDASNFLEFDETFYIFSMALALNSNVEQLILSSCKVSPVRAQMLAQALMVNCGLARLYLGTNNIGDEGARVIAQALMLNTTLVELSLRDNDIGAEGAKALSLALATNPTLRILYLGFNNIGSEGAQAIAWALIRNSRLSALYLWGNNITDSGVKAIAQTLTTNCTLRQLYLESNNISAEGAREIAQALRLNSTLLELNLLGNTIGPNGMSVLSDAVLENFTLTFLPADTHFSDDVQNQLDQNKAKAKKSKYENIVIRTQDDLNMFKETLAEDGQQLEPFRTSVKKLCLIGAAGQSFLDLLAETSSNQSNSNNSGSLLEHFKRCSLQ